MLNTLFDKVYCINLLERKDKKINMTTKFKELGIKVEWYSAVQYGFIPKIVKPINKSGVGKFNENQPYEIGAALSHYSIIKQALISGYDKIFVFEDDVKFHKNFNKKFNLYWKKLPENWDMFMLYSFMYNLLPQNKRVSDRWIQSYASWSLMAYGMNRKMMKEYIKFQDNFFTIADSVTYKLQERNDLNIYTAIPSLCIPETELGSNIRGESMNYKTSPTVINMGYSDDNYE